MGGFETHVGEGTLQKCRKLFLFRWGKTLHQLAFRSQNGLMDGCIAFDSLGEHVDPFAAPVLFIGTEFYEAFLLQSGQKSRNGGMAEMEHFFDIPGAGRSFAMGQVAHDMALCRGQIHFFQFVGDGLCGTGMEHAKQGAIVFLQRDHLQ